MPDWIENAMNDGPGSPVGPVIVPLVLASFAGAAVAAIYRVSVRRDPGHMGPFTTTLMLLTVLVALTTLVIDDSVARAFSLVGALAIVRFRTVVEDTRDTAFVIFAVAVGMAFGSGHYLTGSIALPIVGLVAWLPSLRTGPKPDAEHGGPDADRRPADDGVERRLIVRVGAAPGAETALRAAIARFAADSFLRSATTARQGAAIDLEFGLRLPAAADPIEIVRALHAVDGVQHAELRTD